MNSPVGRERRRKDLAGRMRRLFYGLMMFATAARAEQSKPPAAPDAGQTGVQNAPTLRVHWTQDGSGLIEGWQVDTPARASSVAGQPLALGGNWAIGSVPAPEVHRLLSIAVFNDLLSLRDGIGLDLALPDRGNLHLNVHSRKNAVHGGGKRWALGDDEMQRRNPAEQAWSLGGNVDLIKVRDLPNNRSAQRIDFAPQLMVDVGKFSSVAGQMSASLQYGYFRTSGNFAISDERVPQLTVKWKF